MKETLADKVKEIKALAAKSKMRVADLSDFDPKEETALSRVIKTKEAGEVYMKMLKAIME